MFCLMCLRNQGPQWVKNSKNTETLDALKTGGERKGTWLKRIEGGINCCATGASKETGWQRRAGDVTGLRAAIGRNHPCTLACAGCVCNLAAWL